MTDRLLLFFVFLCACGAYVSRTWRIARMKNYYLCSVKTFAVNEYQKYHRFIGWRTCFLLV